MLADKMNDPALLNLVAEEIRTKFAKHVSPQCLKEMEKEMQKFINNPQQSHEEEIANSAVTLSNLYGKGYLLFQAGQYQAAIKIFSTLRELDRIDPRYPFCMAACCHHLKQYPEAIAYYFASIMINPLDPLPYFHLHDCLMHINLPAIALASLETAITLSKDMPQHAALRERVLVEIEQLKNELSNRTDVEAKEVL